jgi:hypothetical protein
MPLLPPKRNPAKTSDSAQSPEPKPQFPGCATMFLSGVILLLVSMGIVGVLVLFGVDLNAKFWLVFPIFAFTGAFMLRLARMIQSYMEKNEED